MDANKGKGHDGVKLPKSGERLSNGQFAPGWRGGPGRKPGTVYQNELNGRALRKQILQSWTRCDGDKILDKLAIDDPKFYCKLMLSVLPRDTEEPTAAQNYSLAAVIAAIERREQVQLDSEPPPRPVDSRSTALPEPSPPPDK